MADEHDIAEDVEPELDDDDLALAPDDLEADVAEVDVAEVDEKEADDDDAAEEDSEKPTATKAKRSGDEEDEDEPDPDDVEADLDTILKDRIAAGDDEDEEEEEAATAQAAPKGGKVAPRQEDEFVCSSCFLVKPSTQLADADNKLCNDCV